jgi:hypothetical protein
MLADGGPLVRHSRPNALDSVDSALHGMSGHPWIDGPSVLSRQRTASCCYLVCSPGGRSLSAESHEKALA